ncbi:hypothetical protein HMPREF1321_0280 [Capnocytophaga sp. oral taxon 412 str. F0487]|nr:hypothetical protein HMPREF1321_0280 [Capnocytophaga sp. oral taxon 412 str. F0487]
MKPPPSHILRSRGAHTQLLLATFKKGELGTEKGRNDEGQMTRGYLLGSVFVEKRTM